MATSIAERLKSADFMKKPLLWPHWPVLPVKRWVENKLECGVVLDSPAGSESTVYIENLFCLSGKTDFDKLKKYEYDSFEEMVADQWVVD